MLNAKLDAHYRLYYRQGDDAPWIHIDSFGVGSMAIEAARDLFMQHPAVDFLVVHVAGPPLVVARDWALTFRAANAGAGRFMYYGCGSDLLEMAFGPTGVHRL